MTPQDTSDYSKEHLDLLFRVSEAFSSSLNVDDVLTRLIDEVIGITGGERGFIMMYEGNGSLEFKVARGIERETINNPKFEISKSIVEIVADSGQPLLTTDAQSESFLKNRASVQNLKLRSVICSPLLVKGKTLGTIYVDNRLKSGIFSQADLELLTAISASAAIAIENARLFKEVIEKGRMEKELEQASQVQAGLMPQSMPNIEGWEIAGKWIPARDVAGDFYDFISNGESLSVVIGDVVDKGMAAALFMSYCRSTIRTRSFENENIGQIVNDVNKSICNESTNGMFLTLVLAQLNPKTNEIFYVNGGHNPPILVSSTKEEFQYLMPTGMLVGVDETATYSTASITLLSGEFLLLYTDGAIDALNGNGESYGQERLENVLNGSMNLTSTQIAEKLVEDIAKFSGDTKNFDDITIVVIKRK